MKLSRLFLAFILLLAFCGSAAAGEDVYGKPLTLKDVTKISEIMENGDQYIGKTVLVEGLIVAVCKRRGCWMDLASDKEYDKFKIKVLDGVIVFPVSAKGRTALVQGEVEKIELSLEESIAQAKHRAEEHNEQFDPASVTGPESYYRVNAAGAIIK